MPIWLNLFISTVISLLAGSVPFSLLIAKRIGGIDLRSHGSGNVGATNVARTMGARWGLIALFLDAAKGITPVILVPQVLVVPGEFITHQRVLCGVCAVLGHMFSPWLGFRGGKGVATALGIVSVLSPLSTLAAFGVFLLTFATSRIVSLSSMMAAVTFGVTENCLKGASLWTPNHWSLGVFSIAVPLLIILRHRTNMIRLLKGEEPKLKLGRRKDTSLGEGVNGNLPNDEGASTP